MNDDKIFFPVLSVISCALLLSSTSVFAEEGELWQTEIKVEMPGMPAGMPPQSSSVCVPKGQSDEMTIPKDASCKTTDLKKSGNKTSFKLACNVRGKIMMTSDGEMEKQGSDGYRGKIHMVMDDGRRKTEMTQNITSRRLGTCNYQPHK